MTAMLPTTQRRSSRMYGVFRCPKCNSHWESSHVYQKRGSTEYYKQECKKCKISCGPYRVEPIVCSNCGQHECICTEEEKKKRHVDPNKPHRADLCEKCKAGHPCHGSD